MGGAQLIAVSPPGWARYCLAVAIIGALIGMVGLVQGIVWLGGDDLRRRRTGMILAPMATGLLLASQATALVPGFWS